MTPPILVNLAVEDSLSEAVLRRLLDYTARPFCVAACYRKGGYGYLKSHIHGFNHAAQGMPYLILTDLDQTECPPQLIREWLTHPRRPNLLLRVAVREVEAWLLADRSGVAQFFNIAESLTPRAVELLPDPKQTLIALARRSRRRTLRAAIAPPAGSTRTQGPDYNGALLPFVQTKWNIDAAIPNATSLTRTVNVLRAFEPVYGNV